MIYPTGNTNGHGACFALLANPSISTFVALLLCHIVIHQNFLISKGTGRGSTVDRLNPCSLFKSIHNSIARQGTKNMLINTLTCNGDALFTNRCSHLSGCGAQGNKGCNVFSPYSVQLVFEVCDGP